MAHQLKPYLRALLVCLVAPLGWLYALVIWLRNICYDYGLPKRYIPDIIVISVGNLALGGTGKTPCMAYLTNVLQKDYNLAVVSRGYKRTTPGYRLASMADDATTIGDEPYQLYRQFSAQHLSIPVAVGEDRAHAITQVVATYPQTALVLLDDAFQHRSVERQLNLLLTTFHRPFFEDHLLPFGRLREPRSAASRADIVLVTKCPPSLTKEGQAYFKQAITRYCKKQIPIFFSHIHYTEPIHLWGKPYTILPQEPILLLTGLADPHPMNEHAQHKYKVVQHLAFPDHHNFTPKDIAKILRSFDNMSYEKKSILTSEKDAMRLLQPALSPLLQTVPIFFLPISMAINPQEEKFVKLILDIIKKTVRT